MKSRELHGTPDEVKSINPITPINSRVQVKYYTVVLMYFVTLCVNQLGDREFTYFPTTLQMAASAATA